MMRWALVLIVACDGAAEEVSYADDIQPILDARCAECHDFDFRTAGDQQWQVGKCLGLFGPEAGRPAIVPGDKSASGLWKTIRGRGCGSPMPRELDGGLAEVDPYAVELIGAWIEQGALDN